jgi:hypothetical protein
MISLLFLISFWNLMICNSYFYKISLKSTNINIQRLPLIGSDQKSPKINYTKCLFIQTCFPEEDDMPRPYTNTHNTPNHVRIPLFIKRKDPVYTLIWYDCEKCDLLQKTMKYKKIPFIYINEGNYVSEYDEKYTESEYNTNPMFYKDEEFIGDNLYDIYNEIYKEKKTSRFYD